MSYLRMHEIVVEHLDEIDKILAAQNVPLHRRILVAACMFVSECIIEIESGSKENFWNEEWFHDICKWSKKWYVNRYGSALHKDSSEECIGIIQIFGTPFKISVPLSIVVPEKNGETAWVTLPDSVHPNENVLDWIVSPPNLQGLAMEDTENLKIDISNVASHLRSINLHLMTCQCNNLTLDRMSGGVMSHLETASEYMLSSQDEQISLAFWEMQMAVEKAIKLYLGQQGIRRKSHDLKYLANSCLPSEKVSHLTSLLERMPSADQAIKYRYGAQGTLGRAMEVYGITLTLAAGYAKALNKNISLNNASFHISAMPRKKSIPDVSGD